MDEKIRATAVLRTLLVSDIVGSTKLVEKLGDERAAELFRQHDRQARDLIGAHQGREIDKTDGFMIIFERPINAVLYALAYHQALETLSKGFQAKLRSRIGILLGEVMLRENPPEDVAKGAKPIEVEGLAKPMTARLMSLARGRQTLLNQAAFEMARRAAVDAHTSDQKIHWLAHGTYLFKGVGEPVEVFEVGIEGFSPLKPPANSAKAHPVGGDETILGWRPGQGLTLPGRPNWIIDTKIGEKSFGEAWLVTHQKTHDRRLFKFCYDAASLKVLKREIALFRLLKENLGNRDDISRILDWNFEEAPFFIELEYGEGCNLIDWIEKRGGFHKVPLTQRLEIVAKTAEALSAAHSVGVLHKNLKPSKILILENGAEQVNIRLLDFGLGVITDQSMLAEAGITYNPYTMASGTDFAETKNAWMYRAPEIIDGKTPSVQADIYSLGVILFQVVVGDFSHTLAPGWEREIEDSLMAEDIAMAVDGSPVSRLRDAVQLALRLRDLEKRREAFLIEEQARAEADQNKDRARQIQLAHAKKRMIMTGIFSALFLVFTGVAFLRLRVLQHDNNDFSQQLAEQRNVNLYLKELFRTDTNPSSTSPTTQLLEKALIKIENEESTPTDKANYLETLADIHGSRGEFDKEIDLYRNAFELRSAHLGPQHRRVMNGTLELASLYIKGDRLDAAKELLETAINSGNFAQHGLPTATLLNNLAIVHKKQDHFDQAAPLYEKALSIWERELGNDPGAMARGLKNLAIFYWEWGVLPKAEDYYQRSLTLLENHFGKEHEATIDPLHSLAKVYMEQGKLAEAEPFYQRALTASRQVYGAEHGTHQKIIDGYAELLAKTGRETEAKTLIERGQPTSN